MVVESISAAPSRISENVEGKRLKGAQILCECLVREGVEVIFGVPGGVVLPLYDVLMDYPIKHVLVRHEQAAAFAADGYARATGKVGVCLATSGPGATNLVTGIASAQMDSSGIVAITGQVPSGVLGKDAFQETDITGITLPITKHNYLVTKADEVAHTVRQAFHLASSGRRGPVLIDLTRDAFTSETVFQYPKNVHVRGYRPTLFGNIRQVRQAADLIRRAQRPLIIAGHGVILSEAYEGLRRLAEIVDIPVTTTLLGLSSFPESHRLSFGMVGMHGMAYANMAVSRTDLLIGIGMRFDDRVTGKTSEFAPNARVIHIDIDPAEIGKNVRTDVPIVGDVKNVLDQLLGELQSLDHHEWVEQLAAWREKHPATRIRETDRLLPQYVIRKIYEVTGGEAIIVADVGQNQMWAAQHYWYDKPNSYLTSGGLGSMGFALPAAIGAKIGRPAEVVWCTTGDGGFQMNLQELATLAQEKLPIKVAILNNGYLGMVRQWQQLFYRRRYSGSIITGPNIPKLAEAYGLTGLRVERKEDVVPAIQRAMAIDGPVLIDFAVEPEENVFPMIPPGGTVADLIEAPAE